MTIKSLQAIEREMIKFQNPGSLLCVQTLWRELCSKQKVCDGNYNMLALPSKKFLSSTSICKIRAKDVAFTVPSGLADHFGLNFTL